jgi:[protein-PII] uridylyltransferase
VGGEGGRPGELVAHAGHRGLITQTEARQLMEKERAFKDIRVRLHLHAGRREDRLVFDVQTPIAQSSAFRPTRRDMRRASEYLMQRYYWAAKAVTQLNTILLQNIEAQLFPQGDRPLPINERFNEVNGFHRHRRRRHLREDAVGDAGMFVLMTERPALKA